MFRKRNERGKLKNHIYSLIISLLQEKTPKKNEITRSIFCNMTNISYSRNSIRKSGKKLVFQGYKQN